MTTFLTWRFAYIAFLDLCASWYSDKRFYKISRLSREKVSPLMIQYGFCWVE